MPKTIKEKIIEILANSDKPLATHDFPFIGTNENTIASRLPELALEGKVIGQTRKGKKYKEWFIPKGQLNLL